MLNLAKAAAAAILLLCAASAAAENPPVTGTWWNPAEGGRGWNIEGQGDLFFVTHFVYDDDRRAIFYVSVGPWNPAEDSISGELVSTQNGQCLGCSHQPPGETVLGTVRFEFADSTTGVVIYPDGTEVDIVKMDFAYAGAEQALLGRWSFTYYGLTSDFSHALFFQRVAQIGNGPAAEGVKVFLGEGRRAASSKVEGGPYVGLVDASTNFYDYFFFNRKGDMVTGLGCPGRKTDPAPSLTQCFGLLFGSRNMSLGQANRWYADAPSSASGKAAQAAQDAAREAWLAEAKHAAPVDLQKAGLAGYEAELKATMEQLRAEF